MSDLVELLLNAVLELVCASVDFGAGWRFYVPFLGSMGVIGLICWGISNTAVQLAMSVPVGAGGLVSGIIWQVRGKR
jgi:hypothetical protein